MNAAHTVAEVAALLHVSEDSIRRRLPEFQAVRVGRAYRITDAGIEHFIQANRVKAPTVRPIRARREPVPKIERLRSARAMRDLAVRS